MFLMRWMRQRAADAVLAVVALACGAAMLLAAERLPEVATFRDVGPAFFPEIIGWGFVASGVMMLAVARPGSAEAVAVVTPAAASAAADGTRGEAGAAEGPDGDAPPPRLDHPWPRFGAAIAVTAGYVYLLPRFGFLWMTVLFVFGLGLVFGSRNVVANVATAVLATALLFVVFRVWLRVPLPT